MIEVHKVRGEIYCDCCGAPEVSQSGSAGPCCKRRAVVRITAANFSACNPTNITLCEDCSKLLKEKL